MFDLLENCALIPLDESISSLPFSCGNEDMDDFFHNQAVLYSEQRLGKSYCFMYTEVVSKIVAFFTISSSSIRVENFPSNVRNRFQRAIPNCKRTLSYPAVLIGRIGVSVDFQGKGFRLGHQVLDYLKAWLASEDNKVGCRYLVVDAYNVNSVLSFYERNGFSYMFRNEVLEREMLRIPDTEALRTRMMYFDLMSLPL